MAIPTLLRLAEHQALDGLILDGSILDLGGDTRSDYRALIKGAHTFTTVNLDDKTKPDISHDLEQPLPVADASYDHVLLINVLEHIFNYRQLLAEAVRVVKPGGTVVIVVPFLFPIHPSPNDYWRFTAETLRKECALVGLTVEKLTPLGSGVFAARYLLLDRLMPALLRACTFWFDRHVITARDALFTRLARALGKKYDPSDYALGYAVVARK